MLANLQQNMDTLCAREFKIYKIIVKGTDKKLIQTNKDQKLSYEVVKFKGNITKQQKSRHKYDSKLFDIGEDLVNDEIIQNKKNRKAWTELNLKTKRLKIAEYLDTLELSDKLRKELLGARTCKKNIDYDIFSEKVNGLTCLIKTEEGFKIKRTRPKKTRKKIFKS